MSTKLLNKRGVLSWMLAASAVFMCSTHAHAQVAAPAEVAQVLQAIDLSQVKKWNAPYEFRIATFAKDEGSYGSGAMVLLLSNDLRTGYINLQGKTIQLTSVQKNPSTSCKLGETRQAVYTDGEVRLLLKVKLEPGEEACWAKGLISVHLNKHTHRYLVKGVSGL